jgi:two-component system, OmpR family, alkaline phosphatase synthesis response regulator PhoP
LLKPAPPKRRNSGRRTCELKIKDSEQAMDSRPRSQSVKRRASLPPRLLLVEDEKSLVLTLTDLLVSEGYQVESVGDGLKAIEVAAQGNFNLILLDVMLPGKDGFEVCRTLRRRGDNTPIIMLTARSQVADKVSGLKMGADDYLAKPFEPSELLARLEALLRRVAAPREPQEEAYRFDSVLVDFRRTVVQRDGETVEMSAREFELLTYFIRQRGMTVSREELLKKVWGYEASTLTRTVDAHIWMLRKKLEEDPQNPRHFVTVRGLGYKFVESPS